MGKFIKLILLFSVLFVTIYLSVTFAIRLCIRNQSFSIDPSRNILLLGHSMGECSVDPNIAIRIANYCQSAEHAMQSYLKLKFILRDNPQIDTVIAPFNFGNGADIGACEGDFAINKIRLFHPLMDIEDFKLFLDNQILYTNLSSISYITSVAQKKCYLSLLGGYLYLERDKLQKNIELQENTSNTKVVSKLNDDYQKLYISKMIQLCKESNVEFLFIRFPIYQASKYYDSFYMDSVRKALFPEIKFMDFVNVQLPDSAYGDIYHLNHRGAKIFSKILMDKLNEPTVNQFNVK